jgi:hypothetical protein
MIKKHLPIIFNSFLAAVLILTQSWIADAIEGQELFPWSSAMRFKFGDTGWVTLISIIVISIISAIILYRNRKTFLPVQVQRISDPGKVNENQILILAISRVSWTWSPEMLLRQNGDPYKLPADLDGAIDAMSGLKGRDQFPWEQLLRAVKIHKRTVNRVVLIGSTGDDGTSKDFEACRNMLRYYFPALPEEAFEKRAANFDSLSELMGIYREVIYSEPKRQSEIMIDVTGGTKVVSIAAAMVTLDFPKIEFQYVETEKEKRVRSFNVTTAKSGQ